LFKSDENFVQRRQTSSDKQLPGNSQHFDGAVSFFSSPHAFKLIIYSSSLHKDLLILGQDEQPNGTKKNSVIALLLNTSMFSEEEKALWWAQSASLVRESLIQKDSRIPNYEFQTSHFCYWNKYYQNVSFRYI